MLKILVAEDDVSTNKLLCAILKINGYEAIPAFNGEAALDIIDHQHIDLLLCDVMMPKMDGFALTQAIRDGGSMMPILMLTAKALPEDKHTGFLVGTDDYMTKPFAIEELLARIRTAIRHTRTPLDNNEIAQSGKFTVKDLTIDYDKHHVLIGDQDVHLTLNEFKIVALLGKYAGKVLTYDYLIKQIWGPKAKADNQILRVNMANIRRKIEKNPASPEYIFTEIGVGYRMVEGD